MSGGDGGHHNYKGVELTDGMVIKEWGGWMTSWS